MNNAQRKKRRVFVYKPRPVRTRVYLRNKDPQFPIKDVVLHEVLRRGKVVAEANDPETARAVERFLNDLPDNLAQKIVEAIALAGIKSYQRKRTAREMPHAPNQAMERHSITS